MSDWILPNSVNHISGGAGTGKTTILLDLATNWRGTTLFLTSDARPPSSSVNHINVLTLDEIANILKEVMDVGCEDELLIVIDDAFDFRADPTRVGATALVWATIVRQCSSQDWTVVLASTSREVPMDTSLLVEPKSVSYYCSLKVNLKKLAHHSGGVIVEVVSTKNTRDGVGPLGRLWVRPGHSPPVQPT